jgi:cystathionine beta-synthase
MAGVVQLADRFHAGDVVVVIFHDHGSRYLGKMYNDDWMREKGYLDKKGLLLRDLVAIGAGSEIVALECGVLVENAVELMGARDFSQVPISREGRIVGSLNDVHLYAELLKNPDVKRQTVESIMQPAFPFVDASTPVASLATMITAGNPAVLVRDFKTEKTFIITRSDVIRALA